MGRLVRQKRTWVQARKNAESARTAQRLGEHFAFLHAPTGKDILPKHRSFLVCPSQNRREVFLQMCSCFLAALAVFALFLVCPSQNSREVFLQICSFFLVVPAVFTFFLVCSWQNRREVFLHMCSGFLAALAVFALFLVCPSQNSREVFLPICSFFLVVPAVFTFFLVCPSQNRSVLAHLFILPCCSCCVYILPGLSFSEQKRKVFLQICSLLFLLCLHSSWLEVFLQICSFFLVALAVFPFFLVCPSQNRKGKCSCRFVHCCSCCVYILPGWSSQNRKRTVFLQICSFFLAVLAVFTFFLVGPSQNRKRTVFLQICSFFLAVLAVFTFFLVCPSQNRKGKCSCRFVHCCSCCVYILPGVSFSEQKRSVLADMFIIPCLCFPEQEGIRPEYFLSSC